MVSLRCALVLLLAVLGSDFLRAEAPPSFLLVPLLREYKRTSSELQRLVQKQKNELSQLVKQVSVSKETYEKALSHSQMLKTELGRLSEEMRILESSRDALKSSIENLNEQLLESERKRKSQLRVTLLWGVGIGLAVIGGISLTSVLRGD